MAFGEATRARHFAGLDPALPAFLNHGSYGSALTVATRAAARWGAALERQPVAFMESEVLPELCDTLVRVAEDILGEPSAVNTVALVPNATYAVNSVARSVVVSSGRVKAGDVVLCFGKSYGACVSALDLACRDVGATLQEKLRDLAAASRGGGVERCGTGAVRSRDVGATIKQRGDNLASPRDPGRQVERGAAGGGLGCIGVGPKQEQNLAAPHGALGPCWLATRRRPQRRR